MKRLLPILTLSVFSLFILAPDDKPDAKDLRPGLLAEYFDMEEAIEDFPDIPATKKPTIKLIDKQLNYDATSEELGESKLAEHFYVRWTGVLRAPKDGKYKIFIESDDGSRVYIDGKQIIDNNGVHGMEEKDAEVELKAGDHPLKIEMFENEGETGIKFSWEASGGSKEIVPATALFHAKDKDADKN
jgi:hypothetical protein